MPSERIQRRIDGFLDEADEAASRGDWQSVAEKARAVLAIEEGNDDALAFLKMADANRSAAPAPPAASAPAAPAPPPAATQQPTSFVSGRYAVRRFLGEGGKKRVFLAHDTRLDRDVAFAVIKTAGLDDVGRERITREAQAMGRLGAHPNIVTIFEMGEEDGSPFVVNELLAGGDVEGEMEKAGGALALDRALEIAKGVCRGLAFAHERGIVHRDLKPGNVWLTGEGTAKIGDFGLAVSLDRSRLTQHGMMVGTVAYMPPEQALGGDVTPQADLYSFGAMLYELVTGKPPFQAHDPTAVISQHINIAPVAPSWLSDHCPPLLEDLILRCLSKVPADRPKSAAEALAVLEAVDPEGKSASHSDSSANPLDRLARGVFVGRERELERLRSTLDGAVAGRGSVVMLVGEPGIGKTRTLQELETYARMRGAKVIWGRAHESAGAPPYWPWVQAARAYRDATPEEVRRRQYKPYAVELQRIFPGLRELFPDLPEPPPETEEGQFRLFDALTAFARSVSAETPLVFVLDDLHWADRATLQLLAHFAREIERARILVLGTYRDTDLDRRHPLATTLAELNRENLFTRVSLRGLSFDETADYVRRAANLEPSRDLVSRIFEETEGNPFFLSEVVNLMTQEGTLGGSVSNVRIPEGVREALGRRLERLSEEANALLTTLSVAGRDFGHALVRELSEHDDATRLRLLEEALKARVVEETTPGHYRFTHALMRETLLGELSAARRVLLHGQIAEVLERLYGEDRDYLAATAEHYRESALLNPGHRGKAFHYLRRAGDTAVEAFDHFEAASLYAHALELADPATPPEQLSPTYAELAVCCLIGHGTEGLAQALGALRNAVASAPSVDAAAAALARFGEYALQPHWVMAGPLLDETIERLGDARTRDACWLQAIRSNLDFSEVGDRAWTRARELADSLKLQGLDVPMDLLVRPWRKLIEEGQFVAAYQGAKTTYTEARAAGYRTTAPLAPLALAACYAGMITEYLDSMFGDLEHLRRIGHVTQADAFYLWAAGLAWRQGDGVRAASLSASARLDRPWTRALWAAEQGQRDSPIRGTLPDPGSLDLGLATRVAHLTGSTQARAHFARWEEAYRQVGPLLFDQSFWLGRIDDTICAFGDEPLLANVYAYLQRFPEMRNWRDGITPDHLRGAIALKLGKLDEAERHFRTGLDWATRPDVGCLLDAGRCHQGLAEVGERRGDMPSAREHLDGAGELLSKHGAKHYLDQVLAKKEFLKA